MIKSILLQFSILLFSLNSLAYEIDAITPFSGIPLDTICGIEGNELGTYKNFTKSHQRLLKHLEESEPGTKEHSEIQKALDSVKTLLDAQRKSMVKSKIGSTLVATANVILSRDYNLDSSLFFEQSEPTDDLKMTKMVISPSVPNEKTKTVKVSSKIVSVQLSSFVLCPPYNQGQTLQQAAQAYLDTVFEKAD